MSDARDYLYNSMALSICTDEAKELRADKLEGVLQRWLVDHPDHTYSEARDMADMVIRAFDLGHEHGVYSTASELRGTRRETA